MNTLKSLMYLLILLGTMNIQLFAQQDTTVKTDNRPVKSPFQTNILIDNQTVVSPYKGSLNMIINHRFGSMENGITDLFGIYGGANTRLGLEYGITDRIMIGVGTTQNYKLQDLEWKLAILQQTRSNSMPISLSYYGNMVIQGTEQDDFGTRENYRYIHRFSYFTELIVSRKFSNIFSFQLAPEMAYYNGVADSLNNIILGVSLGGRAKIWGDKSIIVEYDQPLTKHDAFDPKPNLAVGFEIGTATHAFQIFVSNYQNIVYQKNLAYTKSNNPDHFFNKFQIGFNITVRF
jgi:hypothetical protein